MISPDTLAPSTSAAAGTPVEIEIFLAGIALGPFTEPKVRERLTENLLTLSDKARVAGTEEWQPLGELLEQLASAPPPAPEPEPEPVFEAVQSRHRPG